MASKWNVLAVLVLAAGIGIRAAEGPPSWAYPSTPRDFQAPGADAKKLTVPGSTRSFTAAQVDDLFTAVDWYADHPVMPAPVGKGRQPNLRACASCHMPNGVGQPQTATLAGLPADYIEAQLKDFALGLRAPALGGANGDMGGISRALTPAEIKAASAYFSKLPVKPWLKVVEADMAPATHVVANDLVVAEDPARMEPLGQRIVEVPDVPARALLRDSHTTYTAYVPKGSLMRGRNMVRTGGATVVGGKTTPGKSTECTKCHGVDLRGMPAKADGTPVAPSLVGRSANYTFRQLYDMQRGTRNGANIASTMRPVVAQLTEGDMIDIAAYLASRTP
jgi:cytochrome c553